MAVIISWLLKLLPFSLPFFKGLLRSALVGLEGQYPGFAGFFDVVIKLLDGGATASQLSVHMSSFPAPAVGIGATLKQVE